MLSQKVFEKKNHTKSVEQSQNKECKTVTITSSESLSSKVYR